jgi:hypothetical protein
MAPITLKMTHQVNPMTKIELVQKVDLKDVSLDSVDKLTAKCAEIAANLVTELNTRLNRTQEEQEAVVKKKEKLAAKDN